MNLIHQEYNLHKTKSGNFGPNSVDQFNNNTKKCLQVNITKDFLKPKTMKMLKTKRFKMPINGVNFHQGFQGQEKYQLNLFEGIDKP